MNITQRVLAVSACILSGLALADFHFEWGLCGSGACDDPRWRVYGLLLGIPVATFGVILYALIAIFVWKRTVANAAQFEPAARSGKKSRSPSDDVIPAGTDKHLLLLVALCGVAVGGHLHFSYVQARILHAWCFLCVTIALIATILLLTSLWVARRRFFRSLAAAISTMLIAYLAGWLGHRGIPVTPAPDPLVRLGGPAIYRPEAVSDVPQTPLDRMRAARSTGPEDAAVLIEVFTDFECPRCAEFENVVWPQLVKGMGSTLSNLRVTYRVFLLEGHPLGWRAAFQCLAAGERNSRFVSAMQTLFLKRGEWVGTGNINAVLEQVPGLAGQSEKLLNAENTKAAKALIREDVARGAKIGVRVVPTVVISIPETDERRILKDVQPVRVYAQVIQEFCQLARNRPRPKPISGGTVSSPIANPLPSGEGSSPLTSREGKGLAGGPSAANHLYVTLERVGPDRVATGWLIKRFADPEARFRFDKPGSKGEGGMPFDIPFVEITHQGMHCAFQHALTLYGLENDQALQKMGRIINDVLPEDTLLDQQREMKLKVHEFRKVAQNDDVKAFELAFPWLDDLYVSLGGDPARIGRASSAIVSEQAKPGTAP